MNPKTMKLSMILAAIVAVVAIGCGRSQQSYNSGPYQQVTPVQQIAATSAMNAKDFDLATAAELIKAGKVSNADDLQAVINNPDSAINNIDLDKDGTVDPVTVTEVQGADGGRQFNLMANPASGTPVQVATINISQVSNGAVTVSAGYPSYVYGYQDNYYQYQTQVNNLAFLMWALSPRPLFIARPYGSYAWGVRRSVFAPDIVATRRTTYDTKVSVSPVQRQAAPAEVVQRAQAQRLPSTFQKSTSAAPTSNNLSDRGTASDFKVRNNDQPVQRATGFGARPATTSPPATTSRPSTASPATTSRSAGASFGGGGGARPSMTRRSK